MKDEKTVIFRGVATLNSKCINDIININKSVKATSNSINHLLVAGLIKVVDRAVYRKAYTALPEAFMQFYFDYIK